MIFSLDRKKEASKSKNNIIFHNFWKKKEERNFNVDSDLLALKNWQKKEKKVKKEIEDFQKELDKENKVDEN